MNDQITDFCKLPIYSVLVYSLWKIPLV